MTEDLHKLVELNERGRCIRCKRRADDMITCERCLEFRYCSVQCLEKDHDDHIHICNIIGIKKGLLRKLSDIEIKARKKARVLNEDGSICINKKTIDTSHQDDNASRNENHCDQKQSKNLKSKPKENCQKEKGKISNKNAEDDGCINEKNKEKKKVESSLAGGRFGGAVKVDKKIESGESFGKEWWKPKPKAKESFSGDKDAKKSVESSFADGKFGGTVKVDKKVESGKNFGKDWWKPKPEKKAENAASSEEASKWALQMDRDYWSDSEEDEIDYLEEGKFEKRHTSESSSTLAKEPHVPSSGLEIVEYNPEKVEDEIKSYNSKGGSLGDKCFHCKKDGKMLKCSRCKVITYCSKACQKTDYPEHKEFCRRKERFDDAITKVPLALKMAVNLVKGSYRPSPFLCSLADPFTYMMLGAKYEVMVEIILPHPHPFIYGAIVRDLFGQVAQVMFHTMGNHYKHVTGLQWAPVIPISLESCIQPGNFIFLIDASWEVNWDGTREIRVTDLEDVHFVFRNGF